MGTSVRVDIAERGREYWQAIGKQYRPKPQNRTPVIIDMEENRTASLKIWERCYDVAGSFRLTE